MMFRLSINVNVVVVVMVKRNGSALVRMEALYLFTSGVFNV